jgi:hypothetical protein
LRPVCQPSAWLGAGKVGYYRKKAGFLASFEIFSALRAGLAGEVRAGSDFKARGGVFLQQQAVSIISEKKIDPSEFCAQIK